VIVVPALVLPAWPYRMVCCSEFRVLIEPKDTGVCRVYCTHHTVPYSTGTVVGRSRITSCDLVQSMFAPAESTHDLSSHSPSKAAGVSRKHKQRASRPSQHGYSSVVF
jgi:hypothetical protein